MMEPTRVIKVTNRVTVVLFIIYLIAKYWILLLKLGVRFSYMQNRRYNLLPFSDAVLFGSENILNVVIFVPLGIYVGLLFDRWLFSQMLLFIFSLSLLVEGLQYILRLGAFDVTDIITNTLGGTIGLVILHPILQAFDNRVKAQKIINIIAASGTILMMLFFVLLKLNMLPVKYQ